MSMDVPINGSVMVPRLGLIAASGDGWPALPQTADVVVGGVTLSTVVWSSYDEDARGPFPARTYRDRAAGRLVVVVKVAAVTLPDARPGCLAVAWVPSNERGGANAVYDLVTSGPTMAPDIAAQWACVRDVGATHDRYLVPDLEADGSAAATVAKAAWPSRWRVRLPGDFPGSLVPPLPADPPTGARMLADVYY